MIIPVIDSVRNGVTYSCSYIPVLDEVRIYIGSSGIYYKMSVSQFAATLERGYFTRDIKTKIVAGINEMIKEVSSSSSEDSITNFFDSVPIMYTK